MKSSMIFGGTCRLAFTRTDLMVCVAILSVLLAVFVAQLTNRKMKAGLARCSANLHAIGRAVLDYAGDNEQRLPGLLADDPHSLWWWYKEQVKSYVSLKGESSARDTLFGCPQDRGYTDRIPFRLNGRFDFNSYVYNGVTLPGMPNIAGLRTSEIRRPQRTLLVMEWTAHAPLSWHRSRTGRENMPFYCDAQSVTAFVDGRVGLTRIYYDGYNAAYTQDPIAGYDYQYSGN